LDLHPYSKKDHRHHSNKLRGTTTGPSSNEDTRKNQHITEDHISNQRIVKYHSTMDLNPIDRASQNEKYATCRDNKFMVIKIREAIEDLKAQMRSESHALKRQLES